MLVMFWLGIAVCLVLIAVALWSLRWPQYGIWPPRKRSPLIEIGIWPVTATLFWSAVYLGSADWNGLGWPAWLRWGAGLPLLVVGNGIVSIAMAQIGLRATSGIPTGLRTHGLYRHSRHPQYLGQIACLAGWFVLSASLWALPVTLLGSAMFAIATWTEDRWMSDKYGDAFRDYAATTPRFVGI